MDTRPGQNNNSYLVKKSARVVTHSDSTNGQHAEETKAVHESVFLETYPKDDINVWMRPPLASVVLFKKKKKRTTSLWRQRWKEITNWSAGGHLQPQAKDGTAILPGVLGTAAVLSHFSALPQRSDGGWDGAEPHTGHRGCNKSQMCWGDMKIHGQAPLSFFFFFKCAHAPTHIQRWLRYLKNVEMSVLKWK